MNINKCVDKAYEGKSLKEIADAPVAALQGVSDKMGAVLGELKIRTVKDLANWKYVKWAQAVAALAELEE